MTTIIAQIISMLALSLIVIQDLLERKVYLWLFICTAIAMGTIYYVNSESTTYLVNIASNGSVLLLIYGILWLYSKFKLKDKLLNNIGLGDLLFFGIIGISFPTVAFIVLFTSSLLFSLVIFLVLKPKLEHPHVPLAGFQALFFILIFSANWIFEITDLYAL